MGSGATIRKSLNISFRKRVEICAGVNLYNATIILYEFQKRKNKHDNMLVGVFTNGTAVSCTDLGDKLVIENQ